MSVLIKGMEMPKEGTVIAIYKLNGKFYASVHGTELCPLVPVPYHGRLIDADALIQTIVKRLGIRSKEHFTHQESFVCATIEDAPTVIPAEPPKEAE